MQLNTVRQLCCKSGQGKYLWKVIRARSFDSALNVCETYLVIKTIVLAFALILFVDIFARSPFQFEFNETRKIATVCQRTFASKQQCNSYFMDKLVLNASGTPYTTNNLVCLASVCSIMFSLPSLAAKQTFLALFSPNLCA